MIQIKASKYLILGTPLFRIFLDAMVLHCIDEEATQIMLKTLHGTINQYLQALYNKGYYSQDSLDKILMALNFQ